jgi:hypothetical protein
VPVTERKSIAAKIAVHPDIEGAVLYHVNELGVTKLEKSKATDYVVIRALREKIKRFLAKFRQQPSIERIVKYSKEAKAHVVFAQPKQDSPVVTFRLNEMDNWVINAVSNSAFQSYLINDKKAKYAPGPADKRFKSVWTFAQGFTEAEKNELIAKLGQALVDLCLTKLKASCKSIETRIDAIDHVPLSSEEKAVWKVRGVAFAKWVWAKFEKQELTTMEFTDTYSGQYPAFLRQFEAAQTPN